MQELTGANSNANSISVIRRKYKKLDQNTAAQDRSVSATFQKVPQI